MYRVLLGDAIFGAPAGPTGVFAGMTALSQQHWSWLDARHLPGSWASTANFLEGLAFIAKDALLVSTTAQRISNDATSPCD